MAIQARRFVHMLPALSAGDAVALRMVVDELGLGAKALPQLPSHVCLQPAQRSRAVPMAAMAETA